MTTGNLEVKSTPETRVTSDLLMAIDKGHRFMMDVGHDSNGKYFARITVEKDKIKGDPFGGVYDEGVDALIIAPHCDNPFALSAHLFEQLSVKGDRFTDFRKRIMEGDRLEFVFHRDATTSKDFRESWGYDQVDVRVFRISKRNTEDGVRTKEYLSCVSHLGSRVSPANSLDRMIHYNANQKADAAKK